MSDAVDPPGIDGVRAVMASPMPVDMPDEMRDTARLAAKDREAPDFAAPPPPPEPPRDNIALAECAAFALNDFGNGCRFVRHFGEDLIFVSRMGWHVWDGRRWQKDDEISKDLSPRVRRMAHQIGPLIEREIDHLRPTQREMALLEEERDKSARAAELEGMDRDLDEAEKSELSGIHMRLRVLEGILKSHKTKIGRHLTHAKNAGNSGPLTHMVDEARPMLTVEHTALDSEAMEINCESGVLQFVVTDDGYARVALLPHDRAQRNSKLMPVEYDPDADCPNFDAFIHRIQPAGDMRDFLARWFGLGMTSLTGEQKLAYFHGGGGNGKSVLVDLIARILGDYASTAKIESLTGTTRRGGGDATPDMIPLVGARMVRASEPDEGTRLQEGLIKELTGGEPILVRALHSDFIEFRPEFKLTISGNHRPEIRGDDDGIWRRVMLVPFDVQIPKEERDKRLPEKLWAERSGILNWLIAGLLDYLERGLQEPDAVMAATDQYREDSDPMGQFLTACCTLTGEPRDSMSATDLRDAFQFWQMQQGGSVWTDGTVSRRLGEKQRKWKSPLGQTFAVRISSGNKFYDCIRLTDTFGKAVKDAPRNNSNRPIPSRPAPSVYSSEEF